jgi:hypothetical protein
MKAPVALAFACAAFAASVAAQDYKLPPNMQGRSAPSRPEGADYRLPGSATGAAPQGERKPRPFAGVGMVKIRNLQCVVQDYRYGVATGEVENTSGQELRNVEVSVVWGRTRTKTQVISHIPAGKSASFRSEGNVMAGGDCQATVSVR